jgi:hypothetical protein
MIVGSKCASASAPDASSNLNLQALTLAQYFTNLNILSFIFTVAVGSPYRRSQHVCSSSSVQFLPEAGLLGLRQTGKHRTLQWYS